MRDTSGDEYAARLESLSGARWKRILNVQLPYQGNLRRHRLGRTLDIGCGIGRNLQTLDAGSVGVDHNATAVASAQARGLTALTVADWESSDLNQPEAFDSLLLAHVVEHMDEPSARRLLLTYLPHLRPGGTVFLICPQERGYATDETHVRFTTGDDLLRLTRSVGLVPDRWHSFPFPRRAGRLFTYNEFTLRAVKPDARGPMPGLRQSERT